MPTTRLSLLERLRTPGDGQAWGQFVDLYAPLMMLWAKRLGLQDADSGDLVQDVMTQLVRAFPNFHYDQDASFRAWLKTVFLNKHRERCRKRIPTTIGEPSMFDQIVAPSDQAEEAEDRKLLIQRGLELIRDEFSPSVWEAFWQYAVCGRSPTEVAHDLGLRLGTIYSSKSRVLNRLRLEIGFVPE